jgi:hypothetical protein
MTIEKANLIIDTPTFKLYRARTDDYVEFTQLTSSDRWVITHNLGKWPSTEIIVDGILGVTLADVVHVNKNKLVINFSVPYTGKVGLKT